MASRKKRPAARRVAAHFAHRANDVALGHVGQVTYVPAGDDDDIDVQTPGLLSVNRVASGAPSFRELLPFGGWYPRSTAGESPVPPLSSRGLRSQQAWLLRCYPEAFVGNLDLKSDLRDEGKAARHDELARRSSNRLPLLSFGEITDGRNPTRPTVCQALAMASGEDGDVLRVVKLQDEPRRWAEPESLPPLHLVAPDRSYEGLWCAQGAAITLVKFELCQAHRRPRRWLLVQTALATMVFEPQVVRVPVWAELPDHGAALSSGPAYISMVPILTIRSSQTGGPPHSDASFDPGSHDHHSRLAVVDTAGNWTVWELAGRGGGRQKTLQSLLQCSGRIYDATGADAGRASTLAAQGEQCRTAWVAPAERMPRKRRDPDDLSSSPALSPTYAEPSRGGRPKHTDSLIVSSHKTLKLLGNVLRSEDATVIELVNPKHPDKILDVGVCPSDASRVFVLTSTSVFWLEISSSGGQEDEYAASILLSCPHFRSPLDDTLRFCITPVPDIQHPQTSLVCLYSASSLRVSLFWFTADTSLSTHEQARFYRQTVLLRPATEEAGDARARSLLVIPRWLSGQMPLPGTGSRAITDEYRFAQVLVLDDGLGLQSALYAIGSAENHAVPPLAQSGGAPLVTTTDSSEAKRRRLLRHFRDKFVVTDQFVKVLDPDRPKNRTTPWLGDRAPATGSKKNDHHFVDLSLVMGAVHERVRAKVFGLEPSPPSPMDEVSKTVQDGLQSDQLPLITLLEAAGNPDGNLGALVRGSSWTDDLQDLQQSFGERLRITDVSGQGLQTDPLAIRTRLLHLWSSGLAGDVLTPEVAGLREALISRIAMEIFLAQVGVSAIPEALPLEKDEEQPTVPEFPQETGLLSPSPSATQASSPAPSDSVSQAKGTNWGGGEGTGQEAQQDEAAVRLARYAVSIGSVPRRSEESLLLSHWPKEPGSDPNQFTWAWEPDQLSERIETNRHIKEAKHRRRMEKRALLGLSAQPLGLGPTAASSSTQPPIRIAHSSQILPSSSQPRIVGSGVTGGASQQQQSQSQGMAIMSQPVEGRHGGRVQTGSKKLKSAGKLRGFR